jgi:hypothetical protein
MGGVNDTAIDVPLATVAVTDVGASGTFNGK